MDLDSMSRLHLDQIRVYQTHEIRLEVQVLDSGFKSDWYFLKTQYHGQFVFAKKELLLENDR